MRGLGYGTNTITSVGGGINLRPKDFAKPLRMPDSPLIRIIRNSQEIIRSSPPGKGGTPRSLSRGSDETMAVKRSTTPGKAGSATQSPGATRYRVTTKGVPGETTGRPGRSGVVVSNPAFQNEIIATGTFTPGGTIVLRKGKSINGRDSRREAE